MDKIEILAVGAHEEILKTVLRLINANEDWNGSGASNEEEAVNLLNKRNLIWFSLELVSRMRKS